MSTYSEERQVIAQNLIDFDKKWSSMMAAKPEDFESPTELEDFYVRTAEFPAGFMTEYNPSLITGTNEHQALATGYPLGKRFKSSLVSRRSDGNRIELGHTALADGKWRIYVFADPPKAGQPSRVEDLAKWIEANLVNGKTADGLDRADWFDIKVIYQQPHLQFELLDAPKVFRPTYGTYGCMQYDRVFGTTEAMVEGDANSNIFDKMGISREGAIIVVRPDQYVAQVLPLTATNELGEFFHGVMPRK